MTEVATQDPRPHVRWRRGFVLLGLLALGLGLAIWSLGRESGYVHFSEPQPPYEPKVYKLLYAQRSFALVKSLRCFIIQYRSGVYPIGKYERSGGWREYRSRDGWVIVFDPPPAHSHVEGAEFEIVCPSFGAGANRVWALRIPVWFVMLICSLPGVIWLSRRADLRGRQSQHLCPACGYDLRATTDRCPECGLPITSP
jgi:hypothetical protein